MLSSLSTLIFTFSYLIFYSNLKSQEKYFWTLITLDPTSGNFFLKLLNPRLDFFLLVVSQIFLKIKKLERNSKIIDRRLEREEREQIYRKEGKRSLTCRTSVWSKGDLDISSSFSSHFECQTMEGKWVMSEASIIKVIWTWLTVSSLPSSQSYGHKSLRTLMKR